MELTGCIMHIISEPSVSSTGQAADCRHVPWTWKTVDGQCRVIDVVKSCLGANATTKRAVVHVFLSSHLIAAFSSIKAMQWASVEMRIGITSLTTVHSFTGHSKVVGTRCLDRTQRKSIFSGKQCNWFLFANISNCTNCHGHTGAQLTNIEFSLLVFLWDSACLLWWGRYVMAVRWFSPGKVRRVSKRLITNAQPLSARKWAGIWNYERKYSRTWKNYLSSWSLGFVLLGHVWSTALSGPSNFSFK